MPRKGPGRPSRAREGEPPLRANIAPVFGDHLASRSHQQRLADAEAGHLSRSCFGFSALASFDLRFTRDGASPDVIEVVELRGDEPVHDEPHLLQWPEQTGVAGKLYGGKVIFDFF